MFFFIDDMCVVFIFNFVFSVIVGLYIVIYIYKYIVKRRRPCFVGGTIKMPAIDLIDWLIELAAVCMLC